MSTKRPPEVHTRATLVKYSVGTHVIQVSMQEQRWAVSVDDKPMPTWYLTQVAAWEAGVREAYRLDKLSSP